MSWSIMPAYYFGVERKPFDAIPPEEWDMMMNINVKGPWICARTVFPSMKTQGKGKIINLASEVFFTGLTVPFITWPLRAEWWN